MQGWTAGQLSNPRFDWVKNMTKILQRNELEDYHETIYSVFVICWNLAIPKPIIDDFDKFMNLIEPPCMRYNQIVPGLSLKIKHGHRFHQQPLAPPSGFTSLTSNVKQNQVYLSFSLASRLCHRSFIHQQKSIYGPLSPANQHAHRQQLAGRRQKVELHNKRVSDIVENTFLKSETSGSTRSNFYEDILRITLFLRSRNFFIDEMKFRDNKAGRSCQHTIG